MGSRLRFSEEWGLSLENDFELYMAPLESGADDGADVLDATGQPFCGCPDCYRRAEWSWLMARAIRGYLAGELRFEEDDYAE